MTTEQNIQNIAENIAENITNAVRIVVTTLPTVPDEAQFNLLIYGYLMELYRQKIIYDFSFTCLKNFDELEVNLTVKTKAHMNQEVLKLVITLVNSDGRVTLQDLLK